MVCDSPTAGHTYPAGYADFLAMAERVALNLSRLTPRELEVVELAVFSRLLNKQIAQRVGLRESTVRGHLAHAREKLGLRQTDEYASARRWASVVAFALGARYAETRQAAPA